MSLRPLFICCMLLAIQSTMSSQPWKAAITYRGIAIAPDEIRASDGNTYYVMQIATDVPWERTNFMILASAFPWDTVRATGDVYPPIARSWIPHFNADGNGGPDLLGRIEGLFDVGLFLRATELAMPVFVFNTHLGVGSSDFRAVADVDHDGVDDLIAFVEIENTEHLEVFWGSTDRPWPTRSVWTLPPTTDSVEYRRVVRVGDLDARLRILAETRFNDGVDVSSRYELYQFDAGDVRDRRDTLRSITIDTLHTALTSRWTHGRSWRIMDSLAWWFAPSTDVTTTDWLKVTSEQLAVTQPHPSFPPLAQYEYSTNTLRALTHSNHMTLTVSGPDNDLTFSLGPSEESFSHSAFLIGVFEYDTWSSPQWKCTELQYFRIKDGQTLEAEEPVRLDPDELVYSNSIARHVKDADGDLKPELVILNTEGQPGPYNSTLVYLSTGRTTLGMNPESDPMQPEIKRVNGGWILLGAERNNLPQTVPVYNLQGRIIGSLAISPSEPVFIHDPDWPVLQPCWGSINGVSFPVTRSR